MGERENYRAIKNSITGPDADMKYYLAYQAGKIEEKHITGMAKMGFTNVAQGDAFANARDKYPKTKDLFTKFGDEAAATNKYDAVMKAVGDKFGKNPNLFRDLNKDFTENPALADQMMAAIKNHPAAAAQAIGAYAYDASNKPGNPGRLESLVGRINRLPAEPTKPITGSTSGGTSSGNRNNAGASGIGHTRVSETRVETPASPVVAAGAVSTPSGNTTSSSPPADVRPVSSSTTAPSPAPDAGSSVPPAASASKPKWTAKSIEGIADTMADKFKAIMGDEQVNIEGFRQSLKTNKTLQAQIAENFNNNPEFVDQMMKLATEKSPDGKETESERLLKQHGRPTIKEIVGNPALLADDKYVDNLTGKLSMASGGGFDIKGMIAKLSDWIGIDLNALLGPIAEFCQKGIAACQEFFGSGKAMSMASNIGDSVRNLSADAADAIQSVTGKPSNVEVTTRYDKDGQEIQPVNENKAPAPEQGIRVAQGGPQPAGGNLKPPADLLAGTGIG